MPRRKKPPRLASGSACFLRISDSHKLPDSFSPKKIMPPILSCLTSPLPDYTHVSYPLRFIRHQFPSHVFASHHLRSCSALPCSCLEPSALGVRPALFSSRPQKPTSQVAHASPELRHRLFFWLRSEHAFGIFLHCLCPLQKKKSRKTSIFIIVTVQYSMPE